MFLRPFYRYETGCAAYVLGCATCAKCAVEKRWNPALSLLEDQFVNTLGEGVLPKPAGMDAILGFNQGRAA